jgi:hypothetical protein
MNKILSVIIFISLIVIGILGYKLHNEKTLFEQAELKYKDTEEQYRVTKKTLLGYTSFTGYSAVLSKSLSEQMKFIGAKINRRYMHQEPIERMIAGIKQHAALELIYDAEYTAGYDLSGGKFKLDADDKGFTLHLNKPEIVAEPAVKYSFTRILSGALFIDEKQATIDLLNKLPTIISTPERKDLIIKDEAVIALCEKKIKEFIRKIIIEQHKAEMIPEITIVYN